MAVILVRPRKDYNHVSYETCQVNVIDFACNSWDVYSTCYVAVWCTSMDFSSNVRGGEQVEAIPPRHLYRLEEDFALSDLSGKFPVATFDIYILVRWVDKHSLHTNLPCPSHHTTYVHLLTWYVLIKASVWVADHSGPAV
jgi:hypothetical protein